MPTYIVQHTPVKHGAKGKKTADTYNPGDEIELSEKEAQKLGGNVKLSAAKAKPPAAE